MLQMVLNSIFGKIDNIAKSNDYRLIQITDRSLVTQLLMTMRPIRADDKMVITDAYWKYLHRVC
jgi:hypothetical protein